MKMRPLPRKQKYRGGFSVLEMVIATALFLAISGAALIITREAVDREEINALALGLASWLETIQRGAQRTTGGCTVTFTGGSSMAPGSELARVEPSNCTNESSFRIGGLRPGTTLRATISTNPAVVNFTPRGTVTQTEDTTITLLLNQRRITRCVRVNHTAGMITMGANNNGNFCPAFDESI
jgi:type II secretory pathway pseudopilin PulG